jgi:hypothetical protein
MTQQCACGNAARPGTDLCARCQALEVLGLSSTATRTDVDAAWRMLAKVWHPDRFPGDEKLQRAAEEKLKTINAAHAELLSSGPASPRSSVKDPAAEPAPARPRSAEPKVVHHTRTALRIGLPRWLPRLFAFALVVFVCAVVVKATDAWIISQPGMAPLYTAWRANLLRTAASLGSSAPSSAPAAFTEPSPTPPPRAAARIPHVRGTQPYVTVGLTAHEVETVLGPPTSATPQSLIYGKSALYLLDGKIAGWKIDPASSIRVKMWPSLPVDRSITTITLGSSRDEVIAVQGTPDMLFADKFAYGSSEVFFENGHVIGWRNNPSSVPLRVPKH